MIDPGIVCAKLAQLRERGRVLDELAAAPRGDLVRDPIRIAAAERQLQVSIEICLDIGQHLIAGLGLPRPEEYRDVFRILGEHGVLSGDFATRLAKMAGFRNRLVHAYAGIDPGLVCDYLQHDRADFGEFARQIAAFLDDRSSGG